MHPVHGLLGSAPGSPHLLQTNTYVTIAPNLGVCFFWFFSGDGLQTKRRTWGRSCFPRPEPGMDFTPNTEPTDLPQRLAPNSNDHG